jgi:tRNA/tmRNA/rRNA uracil-C5-methylase (TrmA/RlmC/RlmD family)
MLSKSADCFYDAEAVALPCSPNTNPRVSQDVAKQVGSARAHGGRKTNGNMKAVIRSPKVQADRRDGIKNNQSFVDATALLTETRYLRNYEPAPIEVWPMATHAFSEAHFATFPPELVERALKAGCPPGGVVLDPFGGSGTVAMVAAARGLSATLIELNPEYCTLARARIEAAFMGKDEGARHMVRQLGKIAGAGPLFGETEKP